MATFLKIHNSQEKKCLKDNSAINKQLNVLHRVLITKRNMENNFKIKKCRKYVYISVVYSTAIWCLDLLLLVLDARF